MITAAHCVTNSLAQVCCHIECHTARPLICLLAHAIVIFALASSPRCAPTPTLPFCTRVMLEQVRVGVHFISMAKDGSDTCVQTSAIEQRIIHPWYGRNSLINDIAVLKLATPVEYAEIPAFNPGASSSPPRTWPVCSFLCRSAARA